MGLADVLLWLLKLLGGEALKDRLGRRGLRAELRVLRQALQDSQNKRDELANVEPLVDRMARERDALFAEVVRLRVENVALREELARLTAERGD